MGTNPDDIPEELPPELPDLPDDVSEHPPDDESKDQEPESDDEEEKKESFDAGPYFEWQPGVSLKDFENPVIQDESIDLLAIAIKNKMVGQRFAIYGKIEKKEDGSSVWHVKFQPSLPSSATPEDLKIAETIFGKGKVVVAEKKLTGIVHDRTREIWIKEKEEEIKKIQVDIIKAKESKNEVLQTKLESTLNDSKNFLKFLFKTPEYETGLSATVTENGLEFLNRGGMNRSILKLFEIVRRGNFFDINTKYNTKKNQFESKGGREFTMEYHLGRSAPEEIVTLLRGATTKSRLGVIVPSMSDPECCYAIADAVKDPDAGCYSFNYRMLWEEAIRHNKEALAEVLLGTVYIATGLKEEKAGEFWTKESDTEILYKTIDEAKKYNTTLDLDKIPEMYADKIPGITALMFAARKNDIYMVMTLIENGASVFAEDNMGKGPLQYAKKESDVAKYLTAVRDLNTAIDTEDVENINKYLRLNLIDITRPIHKQDTALTLAIIASPKILQVVVDYLVENKLSLDTPVFEETALQLAIKLNKLENIKILLRAGADPKLALEHKYKNFYKSEITKLLEKWADPKEMKKEFDDFVNKIEEIHNSFSTKGLLTEKNKIQFKELNESILQAKEIVSTGNSLEIHNALKSLWKHANNIVATAVKEEKDVIKTPSSSMFEPPSFARDIQTLIEKVGKENDFVPVQSKEKDYKPRSPGGTFVS